MSHKCNHKDTKGNTLIRDGICIRCGEEFGMKFLNKQRDKNKRKKSRG